MGIGRCCVALAVCCCTPLAWAQAAPRFDVASVRQIRRGESSQVQPGLHTSTGRLRYASVPLEGLVRYAYGLRGYQRVEGGPRWAGYGPGDALFVVEATYRADAAPDEVRAMMRQLLAQRFGLKVHTKSKRGKVYWLTVASGGARLQAWLPARDPGPKPAPCPAAWRPCETVIATGQSLQRLADTLSQVAGRPVIDRTSLQGRYDYRVSFTMTDPRELAELQRRHPGQAQNPAPSLSQELRQQLGLTLQPGVDTITVLIIDHAALPAGN
ncbi:MAG: TIGR03435 family protein [Terriglobales bacterium]